MLRRLAAALLVLSLLLPAQPASSAFIWADNVREISVTTGTGSFTLAGAVTGYVTFNAAMANNDTCYYSIRNRDVPTEWEVGAGTYNDTNVLARTYVVASSNAGAAVNFSAGLKDVWLSPNSFALYRMPTSISARGVSVSTLSPAASTATVVGGSILSIPGNINTGAVLNVAATVHWNMTIVKTAAGTATSDIAIQWGTNGTTADADIVSFTLPAGTADVDTAIIDIWMTVRGPSGASCIAVGSLRGTHNLSTTGFFTIPAVALNVTSGTFNNTTANSFLSLVITTGASSAWTFHRVVTEGYGL